MPGVTTTRRPSTGRAASAARAARVPAGLALKVSSITQTPEVRLRPR